MKHILRALYHGRGDFVESLRPTAESVRAWEETDLREAALKADLPEETKRLLERYKDAYTEVIDQYGAICFEKGFSMGAQVMMEILKEEPEAEAGR